MCWQKASRNLVPSAPVCEPAVPSLPKYQISNFHEPFVAHFTRQLDRFGKGQVNGDGRLNYVFISLKGIFEQGGQGRQWQTGGWPIFTSASRRGRIRGGCRRWLGSGWKSRTCGDALHTSATWPHQLFRTSAGNSSRRKYQRLILSANIWIANVCPADSFFKEVWNLKKKKGVGRDQKVLTDWLLE